MLRICAAGHMTGTKKCWCGKEMEKQAPGAGYVQVRRHERPRDANGRNQLDELRRSTRA